MLMKKKYIANSCWGLRERSRVKWEKIPMHLAMRKSLVTFGSVESHWSDKGRSQIVRREGPSRGSGSDLLFQEL